MSQRIWHTLTCVLLAGFVTFPAFGWDDTPRLRVNYLTFPAESGGKAVILGARLQTPLNVSGKIPAVLMLHNGSGVNYRGVYYAAALNQAGIATLEIDQYGGRGLPTGGAKPTDVLRDAGGAYQLLAQRPEIDPERIGLTGMSFGGVQTMLLMTKRYSDTALGQEQHFRAAVALYPVCFRYNQVSGFEFKDLVAPVRIYVGTEDDLDDGEGACEALKGSLSADDAAQVSIRVFPNATHAFDGFDGTAEVKDPLAHRGQGGIMHIRPNPQARDEARNDMVQFFATVLK